MTKDIWQTYRKLHMMWRKWIERPPTPQWNCSRVVGTNKRQCRFLQGSIFGTECHRLWWEPLVQMALNGNQIHGGEAHQWLFRHDVWRTALHVRDGRSRNILCWAGRHNRVGELPPSCPVCVAFWEYLVRPCVKQHVRPDGHLNRCSRLDWEVLTGPGSPSEFHDWVGI